MDENETKVREWLAAGDRGDVEAFDRYLHSNVIVHAPRGLSTSGLEAEKAVWANGKQAVPDIRHHVQETVATDSRVAARVVVTGTLVGDFAGFPGSGKSFKVDQVVFAHFRDGLMVEVWEIADTGSLSQQLGEPT